MNNNQYSTNVLKVRRGLLILPLYHFRVFQNDHISIIRHVFLNMSTIHSRLMISNIIILSISLTLCTLADPGCWYKISLLPGLIYIRAIISNLKRFTVASSLYRFSLYCEYPRLAFTCFIVHVYLVPEYNFHGGFLVCLAFYVQRYYH